MLRYSFRSPEYEFTASALLDFMSTSFLFRRFTRF